MIKRLTLVDFMAHARTTFELAPGLNVLTGPNNTGKSAVVEALRCLANNPPPHHYIRHGASEARVSVELEDGTVITWVRRPKYALYELTRPGATEPEVFAKFGRTPPEEITAALRLGMVPIEGDEPVDVHVGNQREPVFLLNKSGAVLAGFFAASTEAAHLIAMQKLLTDRSRKAKAEKSRLDNRLAGIMGELDRLAPLPDLEWRLEEGARREETLAAHDRENLALASTLTARRTLADRIAGLGRAREVLAGLARPPQLTPSAPLAAVVVERRELARHIARCRARTRLLAQVASPLPLAETTDLSQQLADLVTLQADVAHTARRAGALADLATPPPLPDTADLAVLLGRLETVRRATSALAGRSRGLNRLSPPPAVADTQPLAALADALAAARAAITAAGRALARKERELGTLTARITARLATLGVCPLCGGELTATAFLGASSEPKDNDTAGQS